MADRREGPRTRSHFRNEACSYGRAKPDLILDSSRGVVCGPCCETDEPILFPHSCAGQACEEIDRFSMIKMVRPMRRILNLQYVGIVARPNLAVIFVFLA